MCMSEFPYQLTVFLDREPAVGEPVYYGVNGWFPQIAIKRRFKLIGIDEEAFFKDLQGFFNEIAPFSVSTKSLIRLDRMPVRIIDLSSAQEITELHNKLIAFLNDRIQSRFPERDGANYLPHITAEYNDELVIDVAAYEHKEFAISSAFVLKDAEDENSIAYRQLSFGAGNS